MRVVAGERAVHISMSYDQAEDMAGLLARVPRTEEMKAFTTRIRIRVKAGREKGYPKPPLPRSNVCHNSEVKIVDE